MAYPELKYRKRITTSIDNEILAAFEELAKERNQPKSWLIDEALMDLLAKYGKEINFTPENRYYKKPTQ